MKRYAWLLCLLTLLPHSAFRVPSSAAGEGGEPVRTWRSAKGTEIQARFVRESAGSVTLEKEDGQRLAIRLSDLQAADRDYIAARRPKPAAAAPARPKPAPARPVKQVDYLAEAENAVVAELNLARQDPKAYAEHLVAFREQHVGDGVFTIDGKKIQSKEGLAAVDEAIEYLRKAKRCPELTASRGLSKAARDHADDIGPKGKTGHTGSDGSKASERMSRHGKWSRKCGENISFGFSDARRIVIQLIVDDGVPNRGHRENIFNPAFRRVGIAIGDHTVYGSMCCLDFAGGFSN